LSNLYLLDRFSRILFAIMLLYFTGVELNIYTFLAITLLTTASFGYCPLYKLFNINLSLEKKNRFLNNLPKYNPEPFFIFSKKGELLFQNESSKKILPKLKFFKELSSKNTESIIKNEEKISTYYKYKNKTYLIENIGIKKENYIVAYGFNISDIINQGDYIFNMMYENINYFKLVLTYIVPFCVSTYTAITINLKKGQEAEC